MAYRERWYSPDVSDGKEEENQRRKVQLMKTLNSD
jgi:hypothetical protein